MKTIKANIFLQVDLFDNGESDKNQIFQLLDEINELISSIDGEPYLMGSHLDDSDIEVIRDYDPKKFIDKFGIECKPDEPDHYVELMMDNHICVNFENREYYLPENSMLYNDDDYAVLDFIKENYQI